MAMEVVHEDMGEGNMQCTNHPYKNSTPGGICAFCLQEKLGKLVSSSYPAAVFPSSSSSPSPSCRSTFTAAAGQPRRLDSDPTHGYNCSRKSSRLPFVLTHKKKKKKEEAVVFKRSKSTIEKTPRRGIHFLDEDYSPSRRGFWSFLYLSTSKKSDNNKQSLSFPNNGGSKRKEDLDIDRKVARSRSVGCGSRSFSGDFFERISTGFGDCTLRRVESQREGKVKTNSSRNGGEDYRVRCGGIISGFMVTSSVEENGKSMSASFGHLSHVRSKSWGWAFASPMRAFGKNVSAVKKDAPSTSSSNKNATPNLAAIPSLLAVSG